jgi:hypothetical protein
MPSMENESMNYFFGKYPITLNPNKTGKLKLEGNFTYPDSVNYISPQDRMKIISHNKNKTEFLLIFKDLMNEKPYYRRGGTLLMRCSGEGGEPKYLIESVSRRDPPFPGDAPYVAPSSGKKNNLLGALAALAEAEKKFEDKQARRAAARERRRKREAEEAENNKGKKKYN